jgi:hypothetical protein
VAPTRQPCMFSDLPGRPVTHRGTPAALVLSSLTKGERTGAELTLRESYFSPF